jgi:hypothetical protein
MLVCGTCSAIERHDCRQARFRRASHTHSSFGSLAPSSEPLPRNASNGADMPPPPFLPGPCTCSRAPRVAARSADSSWSWTVASCASTPTTSGSPLSRQR